MDQINANEKCLNFYRMHSGFNKFIIIDDRLNTPSSTKLVKHLLAENINAVGLDKFDQLLYVTKSQIADCSVIIYNADGSMPSMCGNGLRCIAKLLLAELQKDIVKLQINENVYTARKVNDTFALTIPKPLYNWQSVPLNREMTTPVLEYQFGEFHNPIVLNVGNPHLVFLLNADYDLNGINFNSVCPAIEQDELFPQGINISFAKVISNDLINARIWERGVGETQSCGSGACAMAWASIVINRTNSSVKIVFTSGSKIKVNLLEDGSLESYAEAVVISQGQYTV